MPKRINKIWDFIKEITEVQDPKLFSKLSEGERKLFSNFIVQKALFGHEDLAILINYLQKYNLGIPYTASQYYRILITFIPQGKYWTKWVKKKEDKYPEWLLQLMCSHFQDSKKHIREYLKLLNKGQIRDILVAYGRTEKEIKKVLVSCC